jgi:hypothetical protein
MAEYRLLIKSSAGNELDAAGTKADRLRIFSKLKPLQAIPGADHRGRPKGTIAVSVLTVSLRSRPKLLSSSVSHTII